MGFEAVGVFSVCDKVISAVKGLIQPVTQSLFPHFIKINDQFSLSFIKKIKKLLVGYMIFSFAVASVLWAFADLIVEIVIGSPSGSTVDCLRAMCLLPLFFGISNILGNNVLLVLNLRKAYFYCLMWGSLFGVSAITVSALFYDVSAVGVSMVVTEIILCILMLDFIYKAKGVRGAL